MVEKAQLLTVSSRSLKLFFHNFSFLFICSDLVVTVGFLALILRNLNKSAHSILPGQIQAWCLHYINIEKIFHPFNQLWQFFELSACFMRTECPCVIDEKDAKINVRTYCSKTTNNKNYGTVIRRWVRNPWFRTKKFVIMSYTRSSITDPNIPPCYLYKFAILTVASYCQHLTSWENNWWLDGRGRFWKHFES